MGEEHTTAAVQRFLNELAGDAPAEPIVRALLDRAVRRLQLLSTNLLNRSYFEWAKQRVKTPRWHSQHSR